MSGTAVFLPTLLAGLPVGTVLGVILGRQRREPTEKYLRSVTRFVSTQVSAALKVLENIFEHNEGAGV